ncbi:DUF4383 domain-containing protein [Mycobacterium spongiae]|uniref:DUF4383 domain-containing protein n=1 Tax=Mycobacterium spongiae TaxID=886343 RepID=A0A975PXI9_9MYCO|nr:DUF4383 domain-containing protein [Mycobacterium spongiae]QUR67874.1 DUF4383 domain-containing protein [Mycobacterium spongiae]
MTRNQIFAYASSVIYLAAGIIGFAVTGFADFTGHQHTKIVFLAVNPLHNVVHLALGLAWLAAALVPSITRKTNVVLGIGLVGAFALGVSGLAGFINIHSVGEPDNYLHLVYGLVSIFVGWKLADVQESSAQRPQRRSLTSSSR